MSLPGVARVTIEPGRPEADPPPRQLPMSPDIVSRVKRREMMRAVRRDGTPAEVAVRAMVSRLGHRFRSNSPSLPGRPDLSNRARNWAIFVHGCFWHGHRNCRKTKGGAIGRIPYTNSGFWAAKIAGNRGRDERKARELRRLGFRVLTVWECELRNFDRLERKLADFLPTRR